MYIYRRHKRLVALCLWLLLCCGIIFSLRRRSSNGPQDPLSRLSKTYYQNEIQLGSETDDVAVVVASMKKENTTWLTSNFPQWKKVVYVTDDPNAVHHVPANRGREGMVYLTYMIDHYDALPNVVIFSHSTQYQWHNDDPLYDGERMLSRVQIPYIKENGYVNLRCVWTLGCPVEIRPQIEDAARHPESADPEAKDARAGSFYADAFRTMFNDEMPLPAEVGASCCAQFAVTRDKIRERPRSDYERFRSWLLATTLKDDLSGRIMEYSWHIIFGQKPVFCPDAPQCYCNLYGLCSLKCVNQGVCTSQYTLPKYSVLPQGWPDIDWEGNWRNITELRAQQELDMA